MAEKNIIISTHQNAINCLLGIEALGKGIGLSTGGIRGLCNSGHKKIGNGGTLKLTLSRNPSVSSTIEIIHLGKQDPAKYCSQVNAAIQIRPDIVRSIISNDNDTDTYVFWIVRHGKGFHNEMQSWVRGTRDDAYLKSSGIQDARNAGIALASQLAGKTINYVFVSDLMRTQQTAWYLIKELEQQQQNITFENECNTNYMVLPCNYEVKEGRCSSSGISMKAPENIPRKFYGLAGCGERILNPNKIWNAATGPTLQWSEYEAFYRPALPATTNKPKLGNLRSVQGTAPVDNRCDKPNRKLFKEKNANHSPCSNTNMIQQAYNIVNATRLVGLGHDILGERRANDDRLEDARLAAEAHTAAHTAEQKINENLQNPPSHEQHFAPVSQQSSQNNIPNQQLVFNNQGRPIGAKPVNQSNVNTANNGSTPQHGDKITVPNTTGNGGTMELTYNEKTSKWLSGQSNAPKKKGWLFWGGKKTKNHKKHANRKTNKNKNKNKNKKTIKHTKKHKKYNKKTRHHKKK